ncbi:MAG: glutamine--fructose-6-phosphate transaminase (isomerizing) [Lentisphaeria bacterium]|nr:glutamine--fructose-6-phosphate transaminase (isomerizing) [Lentisphaeria bacterium]
MCGIVGYIGDRSNVLNVLMDGLRRLEYRGYDSAGVAGIVNGEIDVYKEPGKVANLDQLVHIENDVVFQKVGIAHTRWATHGPPNQMNAHPHFDQDKEFCAVHNGIIENYATLKNQLQKKGHIFHTQTDSEVIPVLVKEFYDGDLFSAVTAALRQIVGTYGIALVSKHEPNKIIVARKGSPIVIGVGTDETVIASDVAAVVKHTNNVIYLDDGDVAEVSVDNIEIRNLDAVPVSRKVDKVDWDIASAEKGGFEHFMLKEIYEQPDSIKNAIRGRLNFEQGTAILSGLNMTPGELTEIERVIITACGTSMHAGMVAEYYFEDLAHILTDVDQAAEFRYRNPIVNNKCLVIPISQSGETADTLAALREAHMKGAKVSGLVNAVGSTIAREAGRGVYLHAGPEISVASTKAFTCQVTVLLMMALKFARSHRMPMPVGKTIANEIQKIPDYVQQVIERSGEIEKIAKKWCKCHDWFFIGRSYLYPTALEGALKLKEISYLHAEGYNAAELKHGPIALLTEDVPVVALANDIDGKDKVLSNMQECKARKAPLIATATEGDQEVADLTDDIIWIPKCHPLVSPVPTAVALQLLSYYVAKELGCSIDQPRNLAKSVTVE